VAVRVFPDTNVLLEFKSLREIPWRELLGTDEEILIVVAQQVTAELNKHRMGPNARLQKRARRATQELDRYEKAVKVPDQDGVRLIFGLRPPSAALFKKRNLEQSQGDDWIMASMLLEKASHRKDRFVLVSADINHRQRARGYGLDAIGVPEEYALEPEADRSLVQGHEQGTRKCA
jgi:predicted ribonuclease YlaK